ncbi:hypothetical protein ACFY3G_46625 [Streptomyces phaeochromogenes]|uniref:hypothetical protein n=1 Tax=Streptomyces phaeochromogenes TaxID=1923 RepID=UPI0036B7E9BE
MNFPAEIKVNIDGNIADALSTLGTPQGPVQKRLIWFAEDLQEIADGRLLLDSGVIVRFRSGDTPDELAVKLRPCTQAQLIGQFSSPFDAESFEYKIENDRSGNRQVLSASATRTHPQGALLYAVAPGANASAPLDDRQQQFLQECAPSVDVTGLAALGPISSTKFSNVPLDDLEVDLERWSVADLDFLELSIRVKPKDDDKADQFEARAKRKQKKLESAVRDRGIAISGNPENKTRRVLTTLAASYR